jgi:dsDNA-specific endonuclease/ATPase MutS2
LRNSSGDGRFPSEADSGDEPVSVPITDVFDLHAFAPRDVKAAVEAYLEEAHSLGLTALRIIHGRGIGAQRETVRKILARTPFVLSYSDAPAEAGGWGATIVTLGPVNSPQGFRK